MLDNGMKLLLLPRKGDPKHLDRLGRQGGLGE